MGNITLTGGVNDRLREGQTMKYAFALSLVAIAIVVCSNAQGLPLADDQSDVLTLRVVALDPARQVSFEGMYVYGKSPEPTYSLSGHTPMEFQVEDTGFLNVILGSTDPEARIKLEVVRTTDDGSSEIASATGRAIVLCEVQEQGSAPPINFIRGSS
jgi:hypothetical protein